MTPVLNVVRLFWLRHAYCHILSHIFLGTTVDLQALIVWSKWHHFWLGISPHQSASPRDVVRFQVKGDASLRHRGVNADSIMMSQNLYLNTHRTFWCLCIMTAVHKHRVRPLSQSNPRWHPGNHCHLIVMFMLLHGDNVPHENPGIQQNLTEFR